MRFCLWAVLLIPIFCMGEVEFVSVEERKDPFSHDEVEAIGRLIEVGEKRLETQKMLKAKMELFRRQKEEFILGNQSQTHAYSMVSNARGILGDLKQEHLLYLFSSEYLEELVFFSSIAAKSAPVRP